MISRPRHLLPGLVGTAAVLVALLVPILPAGAHDVPEEVQFELHVAPEGDLLHVPVRLPLVMLVDYPFPKRGRGYIDLADTEGLERASALVGDDLSGELVMFEGDRRLEPRMAGWQLSLPSDRSFTSLEDAVANILGPPMPETVNLFWNQGYLDLYFTYPIEDEGSAFSLQPDVPPSLAGRLHVLTTFTGADGAYRSYDLLGDIGRVELDPSTGFLVRLFSREGLTRFLTSWEHVLFVVAMAGGLAYRPATSMRPLLMFGVVASLLVLITGPVAGSDGRFAELSVSTAAAASLVVLAVGNVVARNMRHRWITVALCAVPQGVLLAGGVEWILQFRSPGDPVPLVAYAAGALAAAVMVYLAALGCSWLLLRHPGAERRGPLVAALLIGYVGWHYTLERLRMLWQVPRPSLDTAAAVGIARWVALLVLVVAAMWFAFEMAADRRKTSGRPLAVAGRQPSEDDRTRDEHG